MRSVEPAVRPVMSCSGDCPGWCSRSDDFADASKRSGQLYTDFQINLAVPIEGYMPPRPCDVVGPNRVPHDTARFGDDLAELLPTRAPSHDG